MMWLGSPNTTGTVLVFTPERRMPTDMDRGDGYETLMPPDRPDPNRGQMGLGKGTIVHVCGVPVYLAEDVIVEMYAANLSLVAGLLNVKQNGPPDTVAAEDDPMRGQRISYDAQHPMGGAFRGRETVPGTIVEETEERCLCRDTHRVAVPDCPTCHGTGWIVTKRVTRRG